MTRIARQDAPAPRGPTGGFRRGADRARAVGRGLGTGAKATGRGLRGLARVTGRFEPLHDAPGPAGVPGAGCGAVGAVPADRAARRQRRRRRGRRHLAGDHHLLRGRHQRGARPGRALPGPDDAAVRDRGAADRAVPRPVQPRPALGDRRDLRDPRVPVLGAGQRGGRRVQPALPRGARHPGLLQGVRRHPRRRRTPAAPGRPDAGQGQQPGQPRRRGRRGRVRADRGRLAVTFGTEWTLRWAFVLFVVGTILAIRLPEKVDSTAGRAGTWCCAAERRPVSAAAPGSRPRWRSRCAPTAARGGCRASSPCSWRSCCATTRSRAGARSS